MALTSPPSSFRQLVSTAGGTPGPRHAESVTAPSAVLYTSYRPQPNADIPANLWTGILQSTSAGAPDLIAAPITDFLTTSSLSYNNATRRTRRIRRSTTTPLLIPANKAEAGSLLDHSWVIFPISAIQTALIGKLLNPFNPLPYFSVCTCPSTGCSPLCCFRCFYLCCFSALAALWLQGNSGQGRTVILGPEGRSLCSNCTPGSLLVAFPSGFPIGKRRMSATVHYPL
jgi:hypothetical protein